MITKDIDQEIDGILAVAIRANDKSSPIFGILLSFVVGPVLFLLLYSALGTQLWAAFCWSGGALLFFWVASPAFNHVVLHESLIRCAKLFSSRFPANTPERIEAIRILSFRIERLPDAMNYTIELGLFKYLGRLGIVSNAECQRITALSQRSWKVLNEQCRQEFHQQKQQARPDPSKSDPCLFRCSPALREDLREILSRVKSEAPSKTSAGFNWLQGALRDLLDKISSSVRKDPRDKGMVFIGCFVNLLLVQVVAFQMGRRPAGITGSLSNATEAETRVKLLSAAIGALDEHPEYARMMVEYAGGSESARDMLGTMTGSASVFRQLWRELVHPGLECPLDSQNCL